MKSFFKNNKVIIVFYLLVFLSNSCKKNNYINISTIDDDIIGEITIDKTEIKSLKEYDPASKEFEILLNKALKKAINAFAQKSESQKIQQVSLDISNIPGNTNKYFFIICLENSNSLNRDFKNIYMLSNLKILKPKKIDTNKR